MKRLMLFSAIALLCAAYPALQAGDDKHPAANTSSLEPFKQLAGEWVGNGDFHGEKHEARVSYKVTSAGSAVVETIDPGGPHEMVTMIHQDGDALALTHYCSIGNQPNMKAKPKAGDHSIAFEFVSASNMPSPKDMHMHSVTFTFVDKDTLKTEWTNYMDGKEAGKAIFELKRKK
jgi:hypothetical protein